MKNTLIILGLVASIAGCATPGPSNLNKLRDVSYLQAKTYAASGKAALSKSSATQVIADSKRAVANRLKDPRSAQFRNVRLVQYLDGVVVCGEVNGKNSFSGYVGFTPFIGTPDFGSLWTTGHSPTTDAAANAGFAAACSGKTYVGR